MVPWVPNLSQVYLYLINCGSVISDAFHLTQLDMSWNAIQRCLTIHHGWPPPGGGPDGNGRSSPPPSGTPRPAARPAWSGETIQVFRIRTDLDFILGWTWVGWTSSPSRPGLRPSRTVPGAWRALLLLTLLRPYSQIQIELWILLASWHISFKAI